MMFSSTVRDDTKGLNDNGCKCSLVKNDVDLILILG